MFCDWELPPGTFTEEELAALEVHIADLMRQGEEFCLQLEGEKCQEVTQHLRN